MTFIFFLFHNLTSIAMAKLTNHVSIIKEKKKKKESLVICKSEKNNYFVFLILTK